MANMDLPEAAPDSDTSPVIAPNSSQFPGVDPEKETTAEEYYNKPMLDVAKGFASTVIPSTVRGVESIPMALWHYDQTYDGIRHLVKGAVSKAEGLWKQQDLQQKASDEAVFDKVAEPFTSWGGFKKALAEDPFTILSAAAIPLSGGAGAAGMAARSLETLGTAGRIAALPVRAAQGVMKAGAMAGDPVPTALKAGKMLADFAGSAATGGLGKATGLGTSVPLQRAAEAGAAPSGSPIKDTFNAYATGNGSPVDLSAKMEKALSQMKDAQIQDWAASKGNMMAANSQPVDFQPIMDSIAEQRARLPDRSISIGPQIEAHSQLDSLENFILNQYTHPNSAFQSLESVDKLKQGLSAQAMSLPQGTPAANAVWGVHAGVSKALRDADPLYDSIMTDYQNRLAEIKNASSVGAGSNATANAKLAKSIRAQKTPQGQYVINELGKYDPTIPYAIAGASLHDAVANGGAGFLEGASALGHLAHIGSHLVQGDIPGTLYATGLAAIQGAAQSPKLVGKAYYGAGAASKAVSDLGSYFSSKPGVSNLIDMYQGGIEPVANAVSPAVTPLSAGLLRSQISQQRQKEYEESQKPLFSRPLPQDVPQRASGGPVSKRTHEQLVARLMDLADKAKKDVNKDTKPLLNAPDEAVVKALAVAQRAI